MISTNCPRRFARSPSISSPRSRSSCAAARWPTRCEQPLSLPLIFPPMDVDGQILVDGGAMNNVPADVVGTWEPRASCRERGGPLRTRGRELHHVRPGERNHGCDDACGDSARARVRRCRHQCSTRRRMRIARLATRIQPDRGRLQGCRSHARTTAAGAAGRRVQRPAAPRGRPGGKGAADADVHPARRLRRE